MGLAVLLAVSGILHLVRPRIFESIVPHALPAKRELVLISAVAELACAAGLIHPSTRRGAGLATAVLLAAVFPANVQHAVDVWRYKGPLAKAASLSRLPLQSPLIRSAWRAWRRR